MVILRQGFKIIGGVVLFIILLVLGELLAAALTGSHRRAFAVLSADDILELGEQTADLATHAAQYQPEIRVNQAHVPPYIETIWYQAVDQGDTLMLVYYADWPNEIHPNSVFHWLYENYRRAVYGSAHDIEYIELQIDKATGIVQCVRYETAEPGDYNRNWTVHQFVFIDRLASGEGYTHVICAENNPCQSDPQVIDAVWRAGDVPVLGVMTWNHLYELLPGDDYGVYTETIQAPLHYLTDDVYREQKMARRSQGDLKTNPDETSRNILRIVFWSLGALLTVLLTWGRMRQ